MATRVIVGIVALACISICGLLATLANFEMVDKVNDKLPESEQFALAGWYWSKRQRLHREYKRLYPEGRLLLKVRALTAMMFAHIRLGFWVLRTVTLRFPNSCVEVMARAELANVPANAEAGEVGDGTKMSVLSGGLNGLTQRSGRTRLELKTKAKSLARIRSSGTLPG